jgi:hypothetical protein
VTDKEEEDFCFEPLDDSRTTIIEHRRFITRDKLFWALLISSCLLIVNFLGMGSLLGTGPSDTLAPLFVIGVGAFWAQFQILGLFAALLPFALRWRLLITIGLTLALCGEIFCFYSRVGTESIPYVLLIGFVSSSIFFLVVRAFFGLEMHGQNQDSRTSTKSHARFGIRDLFILTIVVALCLIMQQIESKRCHNDSDDSELPKLALSILLNPGRGGCVVGWIRLHETTWPSLSNCEPKPRDTASRSKR